jgi:hypothetical protein
MTNNVNITPTRNSGENIAANRLRGAKEEVRPGDLSQGDTSSGRVRQFEPYVPRGAQTVPQGLQNHFSKMGYQLHWVRMTIEGKIDSENLSEVDYKGYEPVDVSEIPENLKRGLQIDDVAGIKGLIVSKDTALFKIPVERYQEIRNYSLRRAQEQLSGVNENIKAAAREHGLEVKLYDESKSVIATGEKARQVKLQDDND